MVKTPIESVLDEFFEDKENKKSVKTWAVIPKEQYKNLLERYMADPITARIPYSVVEKWLETIKLNVKAIKGIGELWPRGDLNMNIYEANKYFKTNIISAMMREKLKRLGFYEWAVYPDGKLAYSDQGLEPLENILAEEQPNMTAEDILLLINRCLNVVHPRNDLASAFIEGGSQTCSEISGQEHKN